MGSFWTDLKLKTTAAGCGRKRRRMRQSLWSSHHTAVTVALFGGTIGAAGPIYGIVQELLAAPDPQQANIGAAILFVRLCAVGVLATGLVLWFLYLLGCNLSQLVVLETMLAASLLCMTIAIVWCDVQGLLPVITAGRGDGQPGNWVWEELARHLPPRFAYAAPVTILILMAAIWHVPFARRWFSGHLQRGDRRTDLLPGVPPHG